jgi:hypothetical protein
MGISRTIDIVLTPSELATLFAAMTSEQQAWFFARVWRIAKDWSGAGWCQQSHDIIRDLERDGLKTVETLASHLPVETLERLAEQVRS